MAEFVFKNLSVKLLPAEGDQPQADDCACCSYVRGCGTCTNCTACTDCTDVTDCGRCTQCTNCTWCTACTQETDCGRCTNCTICSGTTDCHDCTHCTGASCGVCTCAANTDIPIVSEIPADAARGGDVRAELAAHKARLAQAMAQVEEEERKLEQRGKPQTIEEIDQLKAQFLEAVAELDEHRAILEARDKEPGPE